MTRGIAGRLIRGLRPRRRLRATPEGRWFLVLTVGVGAAAMNTGNNLLYVVLSMNLALIIVSGILSEWTIRRVSVAVRHASEAFAGRPSYLTVTCRTTARRFPAFALSVGLDLPGTPREIPFPDLAPGREASRVAAFLPGRRGALPPVRCIVSTRFPFALFVKSADVDASGRLVVYPAPDGPSEQGREAGPPAARDGSARPGRRGSLIRGVRRHIPSDPVRDIHWKASARLGTWMVKEREEDSPPLLAVRVPEDPAGIEAELSRACAAVLRCEREGRPYRLYIGDRLCAGESDPRRRAAALAALALCPCEARP